MQEAPFIHKTRNKPTGVRFTGEFAIIDLADGRAIGMPLYFFPWLQAASDAQRHDYQLYHVSVNWEDLGEGIDMIAMLTGLYIRDKPQPEEAIEPASAAAT